MRRLTAASFVVWFGACGPQGPETPAAEIAVASSAPMPQTFGPQRAVDAPANPLRPAADGRLPVQIGALRTDQTMVTPRPDVDLAGIAAEVAHNAGYLQRCYEDRIREVPGLKGEIAIHAHITPTGEVSGQCITEDTLNDPVLVACVNTLIAQGRYPEGYVERIDITFPFVFTPPTSG